MKNNNVAAEKSFDFAVRIVKLYNFLCEKYRIRSLADQILRSGTSIGANINEAIYGQSRADFSAKLNIALKEANETLYWLRLFHKTNYISTEQFQSMHNDLNEIISILVSTIKTLKENDSKT